VQVNGVMIDYRYRSPWINVVFCAYDHFEFLSHNISETGYCSRFVPSSEVDGVSVCEKYAELFCQANFKSVTDKFDLFS
jgi:hypothetical protein